MKTAVIVVLLSACQMLFGQIQFEEIADAANLRFELRNGAGGRFHQIELMVGGVAAFDYNNDGCMDIYFTNGAAVPGLEKTGPQFYNRLFRNQCDLTFQDVTEEAGVAGSGYSMAVAAADYDNDSHVDLFVAGVNRNQLFRNLGNGTFQDVTAEAGVDGRDPELGKMWSISAGWFDADNDGLLDLFVSNYVEWDPNTEPACGPPDNRFYCHPDNYPGQPPQLYRNRGDGTFEDVSRSSGVAEHLGKGMGVAFGDFNGDRLTDVFMANDSVRNYLFQNDGEWKFREMALEVGVALGEHGRPIAGMGPDFRDIDDDGFMDIVLTGMVNDTFLLFRNRGDPFFFEDVTVPSGLAVATRLLTGWGMGLVDFDNDGIKDLFTANAHFPRMGQYLGTSTEIPNGLFRGKSGARFEDVSKTGGADFQSVAHHRCPAFADFDNDGRVDVVVSVVNGPAKLFRNVTSTVGHWIALKLIGSGSNRDGLAARAELTLPDGRVLHNHTTTSVGYASSSPPLVRFGLGSNRSIERIEVFWPKGGVQQVENVKIDQIVEVREP